MISIDKKRLEGSDQRALSHERMRVYPAYRYVMLALLSACQGMNTAGWIGFAAITSKMLVGYDQDGATISQLNYLSWIYMVMFIPMNSISTWSIEKKGIRFSILVGVAIQVLGFSLRSLANFHFKFIIVGQTLLSIGQPFIYNIPVKLSAIWFPRKERVMSTTVGVNMSIVGNVLGFYIPLMFVTQSVEGEAGSLSREHSKIAIRQQVENMLVMMAMIEILLLAVVYLFFKPDYGLTYHHPSASSPLIDEESTEASISIIAQKDQSVSAEYGDQMKELMSNANAMALIIAASLLIAVTYMFPTILEQVLIHYGYTSEEVGVYGFLYNVTGIVGGLMISFYLSKRPSFKTASIALTVLTILTFAILNCGIVQGMTHLSTLVLISTNGCVSIAIYSVVYEYAVMITPSIGETISGGFINQLGNGLGFFLIVLFEQLNKDQDNALAIAMGLIYAASTLALILFVKARQDI